MAKRLKTKKYVGCFGQKPSSVIEPSSVREGCYRNEPGKAGRGSA